MEKFYRLFLDKLDFSYDSFDRIVLNGYIGPLHNPANLSYYFRKILGFGYVNKDLLFSVTEKYKQQIERYAREHHLSCDYLDNDIRKERHVKKYRERFEKSERFGVKVALAFTVMRKRIYGPMHYSLFHHQPNPAFETSSKLERLYRQLDLTVNDIQEYLAGHRAT